MRNIVSKNLKNKSKFSITMKIAVESTIKFQKHHLERLGKLGAVKVYEFGCEKNKFFETVKDAEVIISNKWFFNELLPKLKAKLIALCSTGCDLVDLDKCKELGIAVTNVPSYSTNSVAEAAIALLLELAKRMRYQRESYDKGKWAYDLDPFTELADKTFGIIGFGSIGKKVAQIASAMDMKILVYTRTPKKEEFKDYEFVSKEELLKNSDFVSMHIPLDESTKHLIGREEFEMMKSSACIINAARGAVIDEDAMIYALKNGKIAGAGLDVFSKEPLPLDSELAKLKNVVITPHTAFYTTEALERLYSRCVGNVEDFLAGKATNKVV